MPRSKEDSASCSGSTPRSSRRGSARAGLARSDDSNERTRAERDIVVVDSFTSAIANSSTDVQILNFFEECKRLCARGLTIIVTLHSDVVDQDLISPIRSMCDAHLQLRSEQDGQRLVKTLQVSKVRGAGSVTGAIVGFEVEPGWGMRVIPISKARG